MSETLRTIVVTGCFTVGAALIAAGSALLTLLINTRATERREQANRAHEVKQEHVAWNRQQQSQTQADRLDAYGKMVAIGEMLGFTFRTMPLEEMLKMMADFSYRANIALMLATPIARQEVIVYTNLMMGLGPMKIKGERETVATGERIATARHHLVAAIDKERTQDEASHT